MRGTYCAIAVASMCQILTPQLTKDVWKYVQSCQTWDGGISGEPGLEAHGGYTYCGFAALALLGAAVEKLDVEDLLHWLVHRQMQTEVFLSILKYIPCQNFSNVVGGQLNNTVHTE